jgi:hypothetical protein
VGARQHDVAEPGWPADGRAFRLLVAALLAVCAIVPAGDILQAVDRGRHLYPDFFGLWTFGRFVQSHAASAIYDQDALHAYQATLGIAEANTFYPFFYPPWILLILAPLGLLPFAWAMVLWLTLSFAAFAAAVAAWRWPRPLAGLLVLAPACGVCWTDGQNGFLSAALMLGGLRLLRTWPMLAGGLLAAVGYKPQLAVLLPFVLLFGGHWRAMVGGAIVVIGISLAATLAFGADIWSAWLAMMAGQAGLLMARAPLLDMMPTITASVLLLHGGAALARGAQLAGALAGLLAIWRVRARDDIAAQAVVPLATVLAAPYAFHYDLPMVAGGVLAVIAAGVAARVRFGTGELLLLLGCVLSPSLLVLRIGPAGTAVPAIAAATMCLLVLRRPYDEPVYAAKSHP